MSRYDRRRWVEQQEASRAGFGAARNAPPPPPARVPSRASRRGPLVLGAAIGVFLVFAAVVSQAYRSGSRHRDEPPVIRAEAGPIRVEPSVAPTVASDQADLEVWRQLEPDRPAATNAGGGDPLAALRDGPTATQTPAFDPNRSPDPLVTPEPEPFVPPEVSTEPAPTPTPTSAPLQDLAPVTEAAPDRSVLRAPPVRTEQAQTAPLVAEDRLDALRTAIPPSNGADAAYAGLLPSVEEAGAYAVQIASFRSREVAEASWQDLVRQIPDLLSVREPEIYFADLGDRGVRYRVRMPGFSDRSKAVAYCGLLRERGQECLVVRR